MTPNRRSFLLSTAGMVAGSLLPAPAPAANEKAPMSPSDALKNLLAGNERFAAGKPRSRAVIGRIRELAGGQTPFATILACSDSRVPVEILFDHDPGDIFVVRIAGNFVSDAALGSIEYATAVLKSPLVMVLGHTSCGAVKAGMDFVKTGKTLPGHMQTLAAAVAPAAKASEHEHGDWWHNAVRENVKMGVQHLKESKPIMQPALASHTIEVVGGVYDLSTGKVQML